MRLAGSYRILAFQKEKEETHFLESDFLKEAAKAVLRGVGLVGGGFFPPPRPPLPWGKVQCEEVTPHGPPVVWGLWLAFGPPLCSFSRKAWGWAPGQWPQAINLA